MTQALNNLTVLGAGVLGGQIAWHSAFKGKQVVVYDLFEESLQRCQLAHQQYAAIYQAELGASQSMISETQARLSYSCILADVVINADLVIEAVPEIPEVKTAVYQEMAALLPAHTLVATNSSTLLPAQFASATGRPEKYCALHFANMIWSMNLAEVMAHAGTAEDTLRAVTRFAIEIGMVPIPIQKEQNGYVLNTWLVPLLSATQSLITNGVSTPEYIDRTYLIANRGCAVGPCGIMDIIGMKTCYDVMNYWGNEKQDAQLLADAVYIKQHFVDKGKLGLQTGEGYYRYPNPAYQASDFLAVPDMDALEELVALVKPQSLAAAS
ncbi:3-hydroxyacyl-CoA dehydrogenase [Halopseudomonas salina]|uniref:3-hydroxybutyryl-CoA dehydrogenase n=1 Tax=Halopseudomonas salina TaxID=1323744 RepID=A0ABQ1PSP4_9GAMM|nr:3-hydroxyacyl-CoA dehydrogenase [Halopseudomonas salina]GGD02765.1 3-hydroxybutyryl-CoA dehydrogenase [Halopseudomonas salina]